MVTPEVRISLFFPVLLIEVSHEYNPNTKEAILALQRGII